MRPGDIVKVKLSGKDQRADNYGIYLGSEKAGKVHLFKVFTGNKILRLRRKSVHPMEGVKRFAGDLGREKDMGRFLDNIRGKLGKQGTGDEERLEMTPQEIIRQVTIRDLWNSVVRWKTSQDRDNQRASKERDDRGASQEHDDRRGSQERDDGGGSQERHGMVQEKDGETEPERQNDDWGFLLPGPSSSENYVFSDPVEVGTIAGIHFYPKVISRGQVNAVGEILEPCRRPGKPYFSKGTRSSNYNVYSQDALKTVEEHINRLNDLKGRYVEWVEEGEGRREGEGDEKGGRGTDDASGGKGRSPSGRGKDRNERKDRKNRKGRFRRKVPRLRCEDPAEVKLDERERETLDRLVYWAKDYFAEGGWNDIPGFGLGGTPMTRLEKFSLPRFLDFFGLDLAGERMLETPSALLEFMLRLKRIGWREASELLLGHKIRSGEFSFFLDFPRMVLGEASTLPEEPDPGEFTGRIDLRDHECYTIDPADAKDFDDAVGFREYSDPEDGKRKGELHVHIADVTHYVIPDHPIDDDARKRATSVYLPTGVLPMLPKQLSENLCSLRGEEDRLAFSTRMIFDAESGELLDWKHFKSVIRVRKNLSYDQVNEQITNNRDSVFAAMSNFSCKLDERAGRLDIVTKERKIRFPADGGGESLEVSLKSPSPATRMIEQFMVVTNEAVARTIHESGIPSLYRIHPLPDRPDVERWNGMCTALGHEDARLDIDFDSLNRSSSIGEKGKERGTGPMKTDDILSLLQSGGTFSLGGFGGPVGITMKKEKGNGEKRKGQDEEEGENGNGEKREREDEEEGEAANGRSQCDKGDGGSGSGATDKIDDTCQGEERARNSAKTREGLIPMDPEDLRIVGAGYRKALKAISEKEEGIRDLLYGRILSTLPRAVYSVNNFGHFGLNSLCYTHFTSPIRRYPDVMVHRVLADIIEGKEFDNEDRALLKDDLEIMVDICNDQSRAAENLERDMIDMALATRASLDKEYRKGTHGCVISGLTPTSCFLSIDGATEGRIPLSRLSSHRLALDESESRIVLGRMDDATEYARILSKFREDGRAGARGEGNDADKGGSGIEREGTGEDKDGSGSITDVHSGEWDDEQEFELFRLGQKVRCRVHSVELSEGKVDLSLAERSVK